MIDLNLKEIANRAFDIKENYIYILYTANGFIGHDNFTIKKVYRDVNDAMKGLHDAFSSTPMDKRLCINDYTYFIDRVDGMRIGVEVYPIELNSKEEPKLRRKCCHCEDARPGMVISIDGFGKCVFCGRDLSEKVKEKPNLPEKIDDRGWIMDSQLVSVVDTINLILRYLKARETQRGLY